MALLFQYFNPCVVCISDLLHKIKTSDFIRKVNETFITRICVTSIGFIISVIIARVLGPEGRGLYAVATVIGSIGMQFGNLGLHASNTYFVAKDRKLFPNLVGNSLTVSFGFGGLGAIVVWIVFYLWPSIAPIHGTMLILALAGIPFGLANLLLLNLLLGIQEVRIYNKSEIFNKTLTLLLIVLIVMFGVVKVENVYSAGLIALSANLCWLLWRIKPFLDQYPRHSFLLFKNNIRYGLKAYIAALLSFLVLRIDLLMIKYMLGTEQAGYYSVATSMGDMLYMVPMTIGMILFPELSAIENVKEKWRKTKKVASYTGLIIVFLSLIAALLAKPAISIIFGRSFLPSLPAFLWLLPSYVVFSVNTIFMNYFASKGMPMIVIYAPLIGLIVRIMSTIVLLNVFVEYYFVSISLLITSVTMLTISLAEIYWRRNGAV